MQPNLRFRPPIDVRDVSDAAAYFDSGNPQYSVRRGLLILTVFAPIISQGYSEVEKSLQRCCSWVLYTESSMRHTYYVNIR